jgi:hypothetical protein
MLQLINNFLNAFERFYRRVFSAILVTLVFPFLLLVYIFGFLSLDIQQKDDEDGNI